MVWSFVQQQESFLTSRVTHVVRDARWRREPGRARADAMLERVRRTTQHHNYVLLTVDKVRGTGGGLRRACPISWDTLLLGVGTYHAREITYLTNVFNSYGDRCTKRASRSVNEFDVNS